MAKDQSYEKRILEAGERLIKHSHPDADGFRYISTKDFIEGKLTKIGFVYNDDTGIRKPGFNYIYDRGGNYSYFRNADELVTNLGLLQNRPGIFESVVAPTNVPGLLALLYFLLLGAVFLIWREVPTEMWSPFMVILGFYFGTKAPSQLKPKALDA